MRDVFSANSSFLCRKGSKGKRTKTRWGLDLTHSPPKLESNPTSPEIPLSRPPNVQNNDPSSPVPEIKAKKVQTKPISLTLKKPAFQGINFLLPTSPQIPPPIEETNMDIKSPSEPSSPGALRDPFHTLLQIEKPSESGGDGSRKLKGQEQKMRDRG